MNKEITDYFHAKKRQLSSQSENGGYPKNSVKNLPLFMMFSKRVYRTYCLAIRLMCLRNLENRVNSIFKESGAQGDKQIKAINRYKI